MGYRENISRRYFFLYNITRSHCYGSKEMKLSAGRYLCTVFAVCSTVCFFTSHFLTHPPPPPQTVFTTWRMPVNWLAYYPAPPPPRPIPPPSLPIPHLPSILPRFTAYLSLTAPR